MLVFILHHYTSNTIRYPATPPWFQFEGHIMLRVGLVRSPGVNARDTGEFSKISTHFLRKEHKCIIFHYLSTYLIWKRHYFFALMDENKVFWNVSKNFSFLEKFNRTVEFLAIFGKLVGSKTRAFGIISFSTRTFPFRRGGGRAFFPPFRGSKIRNISNL